MVLSCYSYKESRISPLTASALEHFPLYKSSGWRSIFNQPLHIQNGAMLRSTQALQNILITSSLWLLLHLLSTRASIVASLIVGSDIQVSAVDNWIRGGLQRRMRLHEFYELDQLEFNGNSIKWRRRIWIEKSYYTPLVMMLMTTIIRVQWRKGRDNKILILSGYHAVFLVVDL